MATSIKKQKGAVLLVMTLLLVIFVSSVLLKGLSSSSQRLNKNDKTAMALATAKEALINFALLSDNVTSSPGIGYLPCPDNTGDGLSNEPCGNSGESQQGWLPWQTLGTKILRDAEGVCLRYVVSGNYKINPSSTLSSFPATEGHFVIHDEANNVRIGAASDEYALAIVFAGSDVVSSQRRGVGAGSATQCGSSNLSADINAPANYLETRSNVDNAAGTYSGPGAPGSSALPTSTASVFIQGDKANTFNDSLIWVSPQDFENVYARM
jgi:type II secretory pathway pseudopilin PulG